MRLPPGASVGVGGGVAVAGDLVAVAAAVVAPAVGELAALVGVLAAGVVVGRAVVGVAGATGEGFGVASARWRVGVGVTVGVAPHDVAASAAAPARKERNARRVKENPPCQIMSYGSHCFERAGIVASELQCVKACTRPKRRSGTGAWRPLHESDSSHLLEIGVLRPQRGSVGPG